MVFRWIRTKPSQASLAHRRDEFDGVAFGHDGAVMSLIEMLTSKQYEAIGRLAVGFNEVEQMLDMYLPDLLGNPEPSAAFFIADPDNSAARKIEFIRRLLQSILQDRPVVQSEVGTVLGLLDKAKALLGQRNDYIHAFAFVDNRVRKRKLRTKKGDFECNEDEILTLAEQAGNLTTQLSHALHELKTMLMTLRYS
jgi:hypothetical protein